MLVLAAATVAFNLSLQDLPATLYGALVVMVLAVPLTRVMVSITQGTFTGTGIYAQADDEKKEELTGYEQIATPVALAEWNMRRGSRFADAAVVAGAGAGVAHLAGIENWVETALAVWPVYDVALHPRLGATVGKVVCQVCVVSPASGAEQLGTVRALLRWLLLVGNLPFIVIQTSVTGDVLWCFDPRISVMKPVYCGSVVVPKSERARLATLGQSQRASLLAETVRCSHAIGPDLPSAPARRANAQAHR